MAVMLGEDVVWDSLAECIEKECAGDEMVARAAPFGGALAAILKGLSGGGLGILVILKWVPVILELINTVGPQIAAIIQKILDAINAGKKPSDVMDEIGTTPAPNAE